MGLTTRKTIDFITQEMGRERYILLSTEYINAQQLLDFICPNGHQHKIKWSDWKQNVRCKYCDKYNKPVIYDNIKQSFKNEGYKLLSLEYKGAKEYLEFICPNNHKHKIRWNDWQQGIRCGQCKRKWSKGEKEILKYIKNNYNGIVIENDRTMILNPRTKWYLELDIWLPELRKAIEYGADWYHKSKRCKLNDSYKKRWCKNNRIELLNINDNNWRKNKNFNIIKEFII